MSQVAEQLNLFEERSVFDIVIEGIVNSYIQRKSDWGLTQNFDEWLLDNFAGHWGGTSKIFEGWDCFGFSPKGLSLEKWGSLEENHFDKDDIEFIPKAMILKAFGIKDDKRDMAKEDDE